MELIPEAPAAVREEARFAFWEVQMRRDDARTLALARERVRNAQPRQISGLKPECGGGLFEGRAIWEPEFANLTFDEQRRAFMTEIPLALATYGVVPMQPGQRNYAPFHAAGAPLLFWWKGQGRKITANLGRGHAKAGGRDPKPSDTVKFLATEFLDIARWYSNSEWADDEEYENPQARNLDRWNRVKMEQIGFKVAQRHNQRTTVTR